MKNMIKMAIATVLAMFAIGCDKLPTVEKMTAISTAIGKTAGFACELAKTKTEVKESIMKILDTVSKVVPTSGKTFSETWTPIINEEVKKLVDTGKIDSAAASAITFALSAATTGLDYVFVKYPKAKDVEELVAAATTGFINGYKSVATLSASDSSEIDGEAYEYIKSRL